MLQELIALIPAATAILGIQAWLWKQLSDIRKDHAMFREQVARDNVTHATLEKFENRLILSVDKLGDRLDRLVTSSHTTVIK